MTKQTIIFCSVLLVLFSSFAYGAEKNYGRFSMGLTIPTESYLTDSLKAPELMIKTKYKTGLSASLAIGQEFEKFRFEGETSYQKNDFDNASYSDTEFALDGSNSILCFLINGYFDYKNRSGFTPYLGAGLGISRIYIENFMIPGTDIDSSSDEDYVFTYQLGAGVGYAVMDNVSIDINYRYFVPSDPNFDSTQAEFSSHNVSLGLRVYF